jgi:hypothetical protein
MCVGTTNPGLIVSRQQHAIEARDLLEVRVECQQTAAGINGCGGDPDIAGGRPVCLILVGA